MSCRETSTTTTETPPISGRKEHDMSKGEVGGIWVTLTQREMGHVVAVARERARWVDRHVGRFAFPDERRDVARRLNASTAQVFFIYAQVLDPYGECDDLPPEMDCVGREWFVMDPVERIAVHRDDVPEEILILLERKCREADAEGWRMLFEQIGRFQRGLPDE